jgi:HK97 gp10 family phage protein
VIRITIPNLSKLSAAYKSAPQRVATETRNAVAKTVLTIESNAKKEAPVNKQSGGGNLRQSVKGSMTGVASGKVVVEVKYGVFVEEGTRPHIIRTKSKRVLANKADKQIFGTVVHHPGTKANPFFARGIDKSRGVIEGYFTDALKRVFS